MFQTAVVLSVLLAFTAWLTRARVKTSAPPICWLLVWSGILFFVVLVGSPPAVDWLFLFLIVAQIIGMCFKLSSRTFAVICAGCVVAAFVVAIERYIPVYHEHQRILAQYPAVDLKPRLAYELAASASSIDSDSTPPAGSRIPVLNATPVFQPEKLRELSDEYRLERYRYSTYGKSRAAMAIHTLAHLHQGFVADFIAQPSVFGDGRIATMKIIREIDLQTDEGYHFSQPEELLEQPAEPEPTTISPPDLAEAEAPADQPAVAEQGGSESPQASLPPISRFEELNRNNVVNFASSFGVVNERLESRAFQPHAFHKHPNELYEYDKPLEWRLQRLELISLLKHNPPAVYVSKHLPAMNELADSPTRPTNAFEVEAISRLQRGEDVVTDSKSADSQSGELRMVGAIRAVQACKNCHRVPIGSLLGGFSYRFRSTKPEANPVKVKVPKPLAVRDRQRGSTS